MIEFKESKFYKLLQDFSLNNDKETFLQLLAEFYNRTEGIIDKNIIQDELIKELRELYIEFNEKGIDDNIVREKVNYFVENNEKIQDIIAKVIRNKNNIENITSRLDNITIIMPPPSTVDVNTKNLQNILDKAKEKNINLTVQFLGGCYELYTCIIYDNTTIKMTNNTELKNKTTRFTDANTSETKNIGILFMNAKPMDSDDSNITGYNGRSNIVIDGGIIDCISAFCLCHGQDITIKNVTFKNNKSDHYIQIGACKNVKIQNCKFIGVTERNSARQYVEFIQIDWMTSQAQPYWTSTANIFDSTVNDGIEIDGCEFRNGVDEYNFMYTSIGSHSSDGDSVNKNITIKNCKFTGYSYRALTLHKMENVKIDNNIFEDTKSTSAMAITSSNNVTITSTNKIKGGRRGISSTNSSNIKIDGVLIEKVNADSDFILIGECTNVDLNKVRFIDCITSGYNVLIRNCTNLSAYECQDINTTAGGGHFFRVNIKDGGINERITIKDTITDKKEISLNSVNTIICSKPEVLWEGELSSGEIPLSDSINKFKNLKAYVRFYGNDIKDLNFVGTFAHIRDFNLSDNLSETLKVNFVEMLLTLNNENNSITITHNNQVEILNGVNTSVPSVGTIYRITGERVYF